MKAAPSTHFFCRAVAFGFGALDFAFADSWKSGSSSSFEGTWVLMKERRSYLRHALRDRTWGFDSSVVLAVSFALVPGWTPHSTLTLFV